MLNRLAKPGLLYGILKITIMKTMRTVLFILCFAFAAKVSAIDPVNPNADSTAKLILNFYASLATGQTTGSFRDNLSDGAEGSIPR